MIPGPPSFFRIPPFPNARSSSLVVPGEAEALSDDQVDAAISAIAQARVGGSYWGAQPLLPETPYALVRVTDPAQRRACSEAAERSGQVVAWDAAGHKADDQGAVSIHGECDPWHAVAGASLVIADADDELLLIAAIAGVAVHAVGEGRFAALSGAKGDAALLRRHVRAHLVDGRAYRDLFSGDRATLAGTIEQAAFWRSLVDNNRSIEAALGFAPWKRTSVAPLLWNGEPVPFRTTVKSFRPGTEVAIWRSRCAPKLLADLDRLGARTIEVEDGFVRSDGLGADCVPPLSIVVDRRGAHFDPTGPSDLEDILRSADFPPALIDRAARLRTLIVAAGISKYGTASARLASPTTRRHILVPGQVEDDRSLTSGGALATNLDLLRRARALEPDAYISYKPHPDVEAGHRIGAIPDDLCATLADRIVRDQPITALIDIADELHVNTSLAGFEALLRGKPVTTYGVPFYAGWGLTRDLGPVPSRRDVTRTLDELVAAVLLLYPRYLDPITGLPCPPEVLIDRLSRPATLPRDGLLVKLRRLQGTAKRMMSSSRGGRA